MNARVLAYVESTWSRGAWSAMSRSGRGGALRANARVNPVASRERHGEHVLAKFDGKARAAEPKSPRREVPVSRRMPLLMPRKNFRNFRNRTWTGSAFSASCPKSPPKFGSRVSDGRCIFRQTVISSASDKFQCRRTWMRLSKLGVQTAHRRRDTPLAFTSVTSACDTRSQHTLHWIQRLCPSVWTNPYAIYSVNRS